MADAGGSAPMRLYLYGKDDGALIISCDLTQYQALEIYKYCGLSQTDDQLGDYDVDAYVQIGPRSS